jgi:S1-C subfamily serine protease
VALNKGEVAMGWGKYLFIFLILQIQFYARAEEGFYPLATLPPVLQRVEKATVAVYGYGSMSGGGAKQTRGTAFLVGIKTVKNKQLGIFLTNAHIVERMRRELAFPARITLAYHHKSEVTQDSAIDDQAWAVSLKDYGPMDAERDLAILYADLPKNRSIEPVQFRDTDLQANDPVIILGNPAMNNRINWAVPKPDGGLRTVWSRGTVYSYQIARGRKTPSIKYRTLWHNADTIDGNSGGPVSDSGGSVVGITCGRVGDGVEGSYEYIKEAHGYSVPAKEIQAFLQANLK